MNKFIGIGRITKDMEIRTTNNNNSVASFTIAINDGYGEEQRVNFIECVAWNKQADNLYKYCSKGSQIAIEGRIQTNSYEDKDGNKRKSTKIVAESITFLDTKKETTYNQSTANKEESDPFADFGNEIQISDDDLPF